MPTQAGTRPGTQACEEGRLSRNTADEAIQRTEAPPPPPVASTSSEDALGSLDEAATLGLPPKPSQPYSPADVSSLYLVPSRPPPTRTGCRAASPLPGAKRSKRSWAGATPGTSSKARGTVACVHAHTFVRASPDAAPRGGASGGPEERHEEAAVAAGAAGPQSPRAVAEAAVAEAEAHGREVVLVATHAFAPEAGRNQVGLKAGDEVTVLWVQPKAEGGY